MEDKQILALYLARSESAIVETDKKYSKYCHYIAYRILENNSDAEEIVNDTYLKVWNTIPPNCPDNFKSYVGMICRQLSLNRYERDHSKKHGGELETIFCELSDCVYDEISAEDIGEQIDLTEHLNRFLAFLPTKTRRIFVQRYWYAATIAEIAKEFDMKESAVSMLLLRTRNKLRMYLVKEGFNI